MFFRNTVALSVETNLARLLSMSGKKVKKWGEMEFPAEAVKDARITDLDGVAEALGKLFQSTGVSRNGVMVGISDFRSVARTVTLPRISNSLLSEAVQWTARREMTVPLPELYLSWQIIDSRDNDQSVFLTGTPRDIFDPLYHVLRQAGIRPQVMELKMMALSRVVNRSEAVLVNLEDKSTDIIIVVDGVPEVMHTAVVKAEDLLLEERIQKVVSDLMRTLNFFNNARRQHPLSPDAPVYLTGALVGSREAEELLRENIKQPIEPLPLQIKCAAEFPLSRYAVNIGLALRQIPSARNGKQSEKHLSHININIMPVNNR